MAVVNRDKANIDEIDKGMKNLFRWNWLEKLVIINVVGKESMTAVLAECIRKVNECGRVLCVFCNDFVRYASRGCIEDHTKTKKHVAVMKTQLTNYTLRQRTAL